MFGSPLLSARSPGTASSTVSDSCAIRGSQVAEVVNERASGAHDSRSKVRGLLNDTSVTRMVVAHRDQLTRLDPKP